MLPVIIGLGAVIVGKLIIDSINENKKRDIQGLSYSCESEAERIQRQRKEYKKEQKRLAKEYFRTQKAKKIKWADMKLTYYQKILEQANKLNFIQRSRANKKINEKITLFSEFKQDILECKNIKTLNKLYIPKNKYISK